MYEYTVYDRRTAAVCGRSNQPDVSACSENAAIRAAGFGQHDAHFAEVVTRELSPDACRPHVGRRSGDAR